jgi:hypothetical protein
MRPRSPPSEVVITSVRIPVDIARWLKNRAAYYGGSYNAELVRCCRFAMEADAAKDRKIAQDRAAGSGTAA